MFSILQIALVAVVALYLGYLRASMRRRNGQSWDSLIARLRPDCGARDLSEHFLWKEGLNATPDETWERIHGTRGLWAIYQNAGIMQEMADFASRHCESVDALLIQTLRSDAAQIRLCVLQTMAQYTLNKASESVRMRAFHAASMYTGMAARMTQFIQESASVSLPDFVAAM